VVAGTENQSSNWVWLNGKLLSRDEAKVSAFDAGFQHGVGLFETMHATMTDVGPRVFRIEQHLARLKESASMLQLTEHLRTGALAEAVEHVVEQTGLVTDSTDARVRLTLTGGDLNLLQRGEGQSMDPTILIAVTPAVKYPPDMFDKGVLVTVADAKANPLNFHESHKTLNYWWRLRELQTASTKAAAEALVLQVTNHICGGAVSNLFAVVDGALVTPMARGEESESDVMSPVLPGITRKAIIEFAASRNIGCDKRLLAVGDVLDADEVFLTNSSWGVLPVRAIEAKTIGAGMPGEVTKALREAWLQALKVEP
jgi:branched-subunit amino acid aminotransferase/4-amino-4-deoxychorismate lyase